MEYILAEFSGTPVDLNVERRVLVTDTQNGRAICQKV
jgi:hypothetical protein